MSRKNDCQHVVYVGSHDSSSGDRLIPWKACHLTKVGIMWLVWSLLIAPGLPWEPYHEGPYQAHHHSCLHQIRRQQFQCRQTKKIRQLSDAHMQDTSPQSWRSHTMSSIP
uniref:Uncharacterized protein n=1 Tax=Arundo donax TaxID=35708 RepID=A0A0A9DZ92_ARUDO